MLAISGVSVARAIPDKNGQPGSDAAVLTTVTVENVGMNVSGTY